MDSGTPPGGQESHTQSSWIPATPCKPIQPKPQAGYLNGQANQLGQENWFRSACYTSGCSQVPQAYKDGTNINNCAHNWSTTSTADMSSTGDNIEACQKFPLDPMVEWKYVPCTDLLALANAASVFSSLTVGDSGNSIREMSKYELTIPSQHSYNPNFCIGTMPNTVSQRAVSEYAPITLDKVMRAKSNQVSQLQISPIDDRTKPQSKAQNNEFAAKREPNSIWCNRESFQPHTDTLVAAASTQLQVNHNPDKQESDVIDVNKTPQPKPRRKKHRPKVVIEDKFKNPKSAITQPAGSGKRKYERKKGLNKGSTCSPEWPVGEFIDPKTLEPSKESCRKTLNFDKQGQNREENSTCKSSDLVSESGTKDTHERGIQSNSSLQLNEGFELMTLEPVTPMPARSKTNPKGKRKYVRRNGLNKHSTSSPDAVAGDCNNPKPPEPTNESCRISDAGQPKDEHFLSRYLDSISESHGNELSKSELIVDFSKWIEAMTPMPADSKRKPTVKRKYERKQGLNKDSTVSPTEVSVEYSDLRILEPTKKSCRRTLNFDIEGQNRDEKPACRSSFDFDTESQPNEGIELTVQLNKGNELTIENTQAGIAYDLSCSVNQKLKDYMSLPAGQKPTVPLPIETNPQKQKKNHSFRKDDSTECQGEGAVNIEQEATTQIMLQTETQKSPGITNESKCNNCTIFIEPGQAWELKRKYTSAVEQAEANNSNLIGIHYNTLQAYQNPWIPNIHKKKRTEKGQNSSTSSTSSSVTTATDVKLETCYQHDTKAASLSKINSSISTQWNASGITRLGEAGSNLQDKRKTIEDILALIQTERLTKRRSKGLTRVRDLASLTRMAECGMLPTYQGNQGQLDCDMQQVGNSQRPHTCIEALVAEVRETLARKKRTKKRNSLFNSASSSTNEAQKQQKFILYNQHQFSTNSLGSLPELTWTRIISIDALTEQLEELDINKESSHIDHQEQNALVPYSMRYQEQKALVIYNRDGTVVPFCGSFEIVKKRRPRPKVDLDEETNRVWKLLLEDINSKGIDGTDEENRKWWEEERRVFHGRVDSFIARMHLVQGDRRFSKWKGSVVDSVVGVFLTQNVSDHLSSSAFMSLAAQFPLNSKNQKPCYGEGTSSVNEEPVVYILDTEDTVEWTGKTSNQPPCDQSSMTLHNTEINEEKEVISRNESFGKSSTVSSIKKPKCRLLNSCVSDSEACYDTILNRSTIESTGTEAICSVGYGIATDHLLSSQSSVVSSQIFMDSSIAENVERSKSSFDNNSEAADLPHESAANSSNEYSYVKLMQMAKSRKLHEVYNHGDVNILSDENSKHETDQFQTMANGSPRQKVEDLDIPKDFLGESNISPSTFCPYFTQDSAVEVACYDMFREETGSSGISMKNNKDSVVEQLAVTSEFTGQTTDATKFRVQEAPSSSSENKQASSSMQDSKNLSKKHQSELSRDSRVIQLPARGQKHEMQHQNLSNLSGETQGTTESNNACDNREKIQPNTLVSDLNQHGCLCSKELNEINDADSKAKGRKIAKDKKKNFDWDSLRRQTEVNGRKERPENNMDSLDWEAVRCADVNKIANTIKARGMNNMLAERIKDFLNRIVREHGSIDLEWLRDVPPDKAKEYLLSIRGLGLKSVECVRLLTLHHLAFPVDTNVGRIAVRLGWVPLQPLPESLQLHLLELYPVLESIQKYLWPRLCKLDQRTLYELHYQMITFGKVFCTKSKPNCNACPMRGECRHFASAFASSRLALPGPEERSIVTIKENRTSDQNPEVRINKLPLPLPLATEQPEGSQQSEAIVGTNNCEPLPLPLATGQTEGSQQSEAIVGANNCEPIIEEPATPEPDCPQVTETDMEDAFCEDPDEIPTIKLNMEEFSQTLQSMKLKEDDMSKALVALKAEVASIPTPKLKNVSHLRTEHQVYELPDSHPLLEGLEKREPDDPGRYLLAIWTPGETVNSILPPAWMCNYQEHGELCNEKTCFSCNSVRESQSHTVRGTLLIPCRTAMRGSFPLNGTYFQVNEVFADHDSSLNPINVPREWIWNLPRRTVFFGTSIPTIFKGLTTEGIQHCFWRGFVCVRGFDQKSRAPRPLIARLHFPASKLNKTKGNADIGDT